jgi:hypothetical protein
MTRLTAMPVACPTFLSAHCPNCAHNAARYAGIDPVRRRSDSTDLPIVTTAGGRRYVLSEEGLEYDVVVRAADRSLLPVQPGFVLGVSLQHANLRSRMGRVVLHVARMHAVNARMRRHQRWLLLSHAHKCTRGCAPAYLRGGVVCTMASAARLVSFPSMALSTASRLLAHGRSQSAR